MAFVREPLLLSTEMLNELIEMQGKCDFIKTRQDVYRTALKIGLSHSEDWPIKKDLKK